MSRQKMLVRFTAEVRVISFFSRTAGIVRHLSALFIILPVGAGAVRVEAAETLTATSHATRGSVDEQGWQRFEAHVREQAGDRFELRLLIRGEAGAEETYLSHLRRGRVQVSTASFGAAATIVPEVAVLSLPYLFESVDEVDHVVDTLLDAEYRRLFAARGLTLLRWLDVGWTHVYAVSALASPEAMAGRRFRATSSPAARLFLANLGADVIVLPFAEVPGALDTGLIDGGVTGLVMYEAALAERAGHYVLTGHSYEVGFLLANRRWLERLSPEDRQIVEEGYPDTATMRRLTRARNAELRHALRARVDLVVPDCESRARWIEAGRQGHERLLAELGGESERLYATITAALVAYRAGRDDPPVCAAR